MLAVENLLKQRIPDDLAGGSVNGRVQLLSSSDFKTIKSFGSMVGLYLYRVNVDSVGYNRWMPPAQGAPLGEARRELPLNLHFLLISWGTNAQAEIDLHAWAMHELATNPQLDVSALAGIDPGWGENERAHVVPEELSNEDLFKIWDALPSKYSLSSAYVVKTTRVALSSESSAGPVITRAFSQGSR